MSLASNPCGERLAIRRSVELGVGPRGVLGLGAGPGEHAPAADVLEEQCVPAFNVDRSEIGRSPRSDEPVEFLIDALLLGQAPLHGGARRQRIRALEEAAPSVGQQQAEGRGRCIAPVGADGASDGSSEDPSNLPLHGGRDHRPPRFGFTLMGKRHREPLAWRVYRSAYSPPRSEPPGL